MTSKMIFIEFNELVLDLVNKFISDGQLPNFKRLRDSSQIFTTHANAEGSLLNPWVQWVSVHTGLTPFEHGVERLNQANRPPLECIWDKLASKGYSSWICGSMNAVHGPNFKGLFLPDPWSTVAAPFPEGEFRAYSDFVSAMVQEHTSAKVESPTKFLAYMLKSGLRTRTVLRILSQVTSEFFTSSATKWKRAAILDWLQLDLFQYFFSKTNPNFATFFLNSTAHFQHHYWRDMEPQRFGYSTIKSPRSDAIRFGYKNMDEILGELIRAADDRTVIVFCTALSQKPFLDERFADGRNYYKLLDATCISTIFGIDRSFQFNPVMAEQFHLNFSNEKDAEIVLGKLSRFSMEDGAAFHEGGLQLFHSRMVGKSLYVQCRCTKRVALEARIVLDGKPIARFYDVFYRVDDFKSGMHDPAGMLWINDQRSKKHVHESPVRLESIKPFVTHFFDDEKLDYGILTGHH